MSIFYFIFVKCVKCITVEFDISHKQLLNIQLLSKYILLFVLKFAFILDLISG